jgi:hypothetical protein
MVRWYLDAQQHLLDDTCDITMDDTIHVVVGLSPPVRARLRQG